MIKQNLNRLFKSYRFVFVGIMLLIIASAALSTAWGLNNMGIWERYSAGQYLLVLMAPFFLLGLFSSYLFLPFLIPGGNTVVRIITGSILLVLNVAYGLAFGLFIIEIMYLRVPIVPIILAVSSIIFIY